MSRRLVFTMISWAAVISCATVGSAQVRFADYWKDNRSQLTGDVQRVSLEQPPSVAQASFETDSALLGECDACGDVCGGTCFEQHGGNWFLESWLSQGFTWNPDDPVGGLNTPLTFNDFANDYQMNQLYFSLGRRVRTDRPCWDIGAQVDLLYGTDYFFTTAIGLETHEDGSPKWNSADGPRGAGAARYGLAMPQLFADIFVPLGTGVTVKVGHFYTTLGYENVTAPDNFFYSHSYVMQYGQPRTHTGVIAEWDFSCCLKAHAGATRGWDIWDAPDSDSAFLGGLAWKSWDQRSSVAFVIHSGDEGTGDNGESNSRTVYSLVLTRNISSCFTYVLQHDYGWEENGAISAAGEREDAKWYGINQYLMYQISPTAAFGMRFEWFRDQHNARVLSIPLERTVDGGNYTALTMGSNIKLKPYMTLRPELRWDWSDVVPFGLGRNGMFNDFTERNQFTLATDLIIRF